VVTFETSPYFPRLYFADLLNRSEARFAAASFVDLDFFIFRGKSGQKWVLTKSMDTTQLEGIYEWSWAGGTFQVELRPRGKMKSTSELFVFFAY
jgi:hypothetical protein